MTKEFTIGNREILLVFRHKWDESSKKDFGRGMFRKYRLGLFFEKNIVLGFGIRGTEESVGEFFKRSKDVNSYMFGINLIVAKAWFTIHKCQLPS